MNKIDLKLIEETFKNTINEIEKVGNNIDFFNQYVSTLTIHSVDNNKITLIAKNDFSQQIITNDFLPKIEQIFNKNIPLFNFEFFVTTKEKISQKKNVVRRNTMVGIEGVNKNYTFANFIVGDFNKKAVLSSKSIVSNNFINPLFICANVGLGKTHLLHAIGNEYNKKFPFKFIKYISADDFSREIYKALYDEDKMAIETVKTKYEKYDLLLIDDIQILLNKNKIREILFNIFNSNISNNKYVVWTSDTDPDNLEGFEQRIKSRFHSGIFATIKKPDKTMLKNIANKKIKNLNADIVLSEDALNYIVNRNNGDIRRLEGQINQIFFFASSNSLKNPIIDLQMVKMIFEPLNKGEIKKYGLDFDPNIIIDQVALNYGVNANMLKSKSRVGKLVNPRSIAMYILRKKCNMTYAQIGQLFSGRHHSTIITAINNVEGLLNKNVDLKNIIEKIYYKI